MPEISFMPLPLATIKEIKNTNRQEILIKGIYKRVYRTPTNLYIKTKKGKCYLFPEEII